MKEFADSANFGAVIMVLTSVVFFVLKLFEPAIYLILLSVFLELMINWAMKNKP